MIQRCENPKNPGYKYYGARGITVCQQWHDFVVFYADMADMPKGQTLDRIDNNGNYEPGNCRWISHRVNSQNTRRARMLTFRGKTQCVSAWADELGVPHDRLYGRLKRGWSVERMLTSPVQKR